MGSPRVGSNPTGVDFAAEHLQMDVAAVDAELLCTAASLFLFPNVARALSLYKPGRAYVWAWGHMCGLEQIFGLRICVACEHANALNCARRAEVLSTKRCLIRKLNWYIFHDANTAETLWPSG